MVDANSAELVDVVRALVALAADVRDEEALELLATSRSSFARLSAAALCAVRARAATTRLSAAQAAIGAVRRAVHCGLSNAGTKKNESAKRACYSPERLALGVSSADMLALVRLVEAVDALCDGALEPETLPAAPHGSSGGVLPRLAELLLALALPAPNTAALCALAAVAVPRARAVVRAAVESAARATPAPQPCAGRAALRALCDCLPKRAHRPLPPRTPPSAARDVAASAGSCEGVEAGGVRLWSPPPGFRPISPEPLAAPLAPPAHAQQPTRAASGAPAGPRPKRPREPLGQALATALNSTAGAAGFERAARGGKRAPARRGGAAGASAVPVAATGNASILSYFTSAAAVGASPLAAARPE
jgi:hypothetical protein